MKVIILGSNGMLGSYLTSYLRDKFEVIPMTRNDYDLSKINELEFINFISTKISKGDLIINASGIIKQRDYNPLEMIMLNSVLPHILSKIKIEYNCNVIHITTDCVFSGIIGYYKENDIHDCIDDYGKSKSLGENELLTTIRTSIIGEEINNKKSLLEWVRSNSNKAIDGYSNHLWNGVTCLELSKKILNIINENSFWTGVRHIHSPDVVNKYELLKIINEIYDLNIIVNLTKTNTHIYRNLLSNYENNITNSLYNQLVELKKYNL
jgi:dTDP-4-dehydrorhamnose reductase